MKRDGEIRSQIMMLQEKPEKIEMQEIADKFFKAEQYLNDEVATEIYKRFGIGIRFHI